MLHIIWPVMFVNGKEDFWNLYKDKLEEIKNVIAQNCKNIKFYFNSYDSGTSPAVIVDQLLKTQKVLKLNLSDVTIVTGNTYEKFAVEQLLLGKEIFNVNFEIGDREIINAISDYTYYLKNYKKRFIFLCRKETVWRNLIFFDLLRRGVFQTNNRLFASSNAIYTWSKFNPYEETQATNEEIKNSLLKLLDDFNDETYTSKMKTYVIENYKRICNNSPYTILGELEEKKEILAVRNYSKLVKETYPAVFQNTGTALANALNSSSLSLTIETHYEDAAIQVSLHLTEKTIRTMFFKLPFLTYANATFLAKLRSMGFETFGDFWDESYDYELDPYKRMLKINKQVEEFNEMYWSEFHSLMAKTSEVTNHNYNKLIKLMDMYDKDYNQKSLEGKLIWNKAHNIFN